jgi:bifunctional UDP-N-acetylglucosamine pyrophosphorylase/glucosamine-1-phosphate N-acetyltransferase
MLQKNIIKQKIHICILLAGLATRININNYDDKNQIIKAFLEIGSQPIIFHIIYSILNGIQNFILNSKEIEICMSIIINKNFDKNKQELILNFIKKINFEFIKIEFIVQENINGTFFAIKELINKTIFNKSYSDDDLMMIFLGDHPLVTQETITEIFLNFNIKSQNYLGLFACFKNKNLDNKFGRIKLNLENDQASIETIHEYKEYQNNKDIKSFEICNGPISIFRSHVVKNFVINYIQSADKNQELYFHRIIDYYRKKSKQYIFSNFTLKEDNNYEFLYSLNTFKELNETEKIFQILQRKKFLSKNIFFENIDSVVFAPFVEIDDFSKIYSNIKFKSFVKIQKFTIIENFSVIGENVDIGENVLIKSHSIISNSTIKNFCKIGPFAHIYENNTIESNNVIGNFMEIKRSEISCNNKMKHFCYISDSKIGKSNNFGAGTIFCNYDGYKKNKTFIGDYNFIGANNSLIAPLNIGSNNITAAGSVITFDIKDNTLSIARSRQINKNINKSDKIQD